MINLQTIPIQRLKPAPYNPRVRLAPGSPAYERLERSLREFSLVQPLVWNRRTGHVVAGHQRLEILKRQGAEEVDAVVVDLPLEREKALNITLNNAQVGGEWDADKLAGVLSELAELPDFDATLTGFDEGDIRDLLLAPAPAAAENDPPENDDAKVRVTIVIPEERWDEVRPAIDELLGQLNLEVHVRLPE